MNDFTKEELNLLADTVALSIGRFTWIGHSVDELLDLSSKLDSMIKNYCKHDWRSSATDAIYCPHCQKHVECQL